MSDEQNADGQQVDTGGSDGNGKGNSQGDQGKTATEVIKDNQPTFLESLPEEYRDHEAFKEIKEPKDLAGKYLDLVKSQPVIPGKPEEYEIKGPDGALKNELFPKDFQETVHKAGLTQAQVDAVSTWWFDKTKILMDQQAQTRTDAEKTLKTEWGDKFDANLETARKAISTIVDPEFKKWLDDSGMGNHPAMVKAFAKIGKAISEDTLREGFQQKPELKRTMGGEPVISFKSMEKK